MVLQLFLSESHISANIFTAQLIYLVSIGSDSWVQLGFVPIGVWASNISELQQKENSDSLFTPCAGCSIGFLCWELFLATWVPLFFRVNEQLANVFPVASAFLLLFSLTGHRERGRGVSLCDKVADCYWQTVKQSDREWKKYTVISSLTSTSGVCLDLSVWPLASTDTLNPCPPLTFALSLCSDGGVGERAGRTAEDARPGEPQLLYAGEEDLCVEAPAADTATRSGETDGVTLTLKT